MNAQTRPPLQRCPWPGNDPLYVAYHDQEWGVPEWDDNALFEKLTLDGFQAGLSWLVILRKRENFRRALAGFDARKIAAFSPRKIDKLLQDAGIVRHRGKLEAAVSNAKAFLRVMDTTQGFAALLWDFVDGTPQCNHWRSMEQVPAQTAMSRAMSKELRARGFTFCGPTIVYAFAQACGMVNDHLTGCFRHEECRQLAKSTAMP